MKSYRFGKHAPKKDYRTLRLKKYLTPQLPAPPPSVDTLARVYAKLGINDPGTLFPMDGNDTLGDCTIAALAHAITVNDGLVGTKKIMTRQAVVKLYLHLTGGEDTGLDEMTVLKYWQKIAVDGEKILAFAAIDPKNHDHVKQAVQLFGGVYIGFQVQQNCVSDFDNGRPWIPGQLTTDGHAVYVVGYDEETVTVLTWGSTQKGTWDWWDECVDESYALLPQEAKKRDFSPGFDFAQLKKDLGAVAGSVAVATAAEAELV